MSRTDRLRQRDHPPRRCPPSDEVPTSYATCPPPPANALRFRWLRAATRPELEPSSIPDPQAAEIDSWWPDRMLPAGDKWRTVFADEKPAWDYAVDLANWSLLRRTRSSRQLHETMTDFWSNHFHVRCRTATRRTTRFDHASPYPGAHSRAPTASSVCIRSSRRSSRSGRRAAWPPPRQPAWRSPTGRTSQRWKSRRRRPGLRRTPWLDQPNHRAGQRQLPCRGGPVRYDDRANLDDWPCAGDRDQKHEGAHPRRRRPAMG